VSVEAVSDQDIRGACLAVTKSTDLAEQIGAAAFRAALAAIGSARSRLQKR